MIVVDTDILIDGLNGREPSSRWLREAILREEIATTAVTRFELLAGALSPRALKATRRFLQDLEVLPLDAAAADRAAEIHRQLARQGAVVGTPDTLIAGIALIHKARLATRNTRHFGRIPELDLVPVA